MGQSSSQRWMTVVRNHAQAMIACDVFVSATIGYQVIYVFLIREVGWRRRVPLNVTSPPTAAWTLQQFREVRDNEHGYRFVIGNPDSLYFKELDLGVRALGVRNSQTPFRSAQANSQCERLVGSLRRDCLDSWFPSVRVPGREF